MLNNTNLLEKEFLDYGFSRRDYIHIRESDSLIIIKGNILLEHFRSTNTFFYNNDYTKKDVISYVFFYLYLFLYRLYVPNKFPS